MVVECIVNTDITLENYLRKKHLSPKTIYKLCQANAISSLDKILNKESVLTNGEHIYINFSLLETNDEQDESIDMHNSFNIIYEDDDIIAVDKKKNALIHSDGNTKETILNYLVHYLKEKGDDSYLRPLHRIDIETKGLCLFSKNIISYNDIEYQIENNKVTKTYLAYVNGVITEGDELTLLIGRDRHDSKKYVVSKTGKLAITAYKPIKVCRDRTLLEIKIVTGRTHQIRVSMAYINHSVIGDKLYGKGETEDLKLLSKSMSFTLNDKKVVITSEQSL